MKLVAVLIMTLGLFVLSSNTFAAAEFRLGIVDFQRALNGVDEGKVAKTKLEKEAKAKEAEFAEKAKKLEKMKAELDDLKIKEQSNLLKGAELTKVKKLEETVQKDYMDFIQSRDRFQREGIDKERAATEEILRKLRGIVEDLGRSGGFTMVLEKSSGLIYAAEATDFTEKAIQKYNSQYKAGSVKEDKPAKEEKK
jgi:outer membrane protein